MTSAVPELSRADVLGKLEELLGSERRRYYFALHGTGDDDRLQVSGAPGEVTVVPVRSELELRRRLLELGEAPCAAFLVPWEGTLPLDLQGRFAKDGYIFRVGRETRILGLFGAVECDPEVRGSPLVDYLLEHEGSQRFASGGRLTVERLWQAWLSRRWRFDMEGGLALDALIGWAAVDPRGSEFVRAMEGAPEVRAALLAFLEAGLGPAGPVVWEAWERGQGEGVAELAVLAAAIGGEATGSAAVWWEYAGKERLGLAPALLTAITPRLAEVSEAALRAIVERSDERTVRRIAAAADTRVHESVRPLVVGSARLPSAWQARLDALGEALLAAAKAPSREAAAEAVRCFRALRGHVLYSDERAVVIERAEMAVRLAGWLAVRPDRERLADNTPYAELESLAAWYADEGGFVDWARRWARGGGQGRVFDGIRAVVAKADQERVVLDRRFAAGLGPYHEAGRPSDRCVPIDQALQRIAGRFLEENGERRLLVLLMDGMAWAQAVEILSALGTESVPWGPLDWHALRKNRVGDGAYPPVLANFPTNTDVSRSALFAGKPMAPGKEHKSSDDPKRWEAHKVARAFTAEGVKPYLLLRGEGHTKDGAASAEALTAVEDDRRRIVGVVINAIDDALKGDSAQRSRWTADTIKSLRDLLDKSREVGRTVLLCADHGNVPSDCFETAGGASSMGPRWRVWDSPGDVIADFEVGLPADRDGVWAPRGAHGVILAADDAHKYGSASGAGAHGGATLAEAVAPCVLIGSEDHAGIEDDPALSIRPAVVPSWWAFDLGGDQVEVVAEPEAKPRRQPKPGRKNQLSLPELAKAVEPAPPPPRAVESAFARSAILKARTRDASARDEVVRAVDFLLARNGIVDAGAFASALGEFPHRVPGLVSRLQEVLNVDGYQILSFDRGSQQVRLDRGKLAEQFEVTL